MWVALFCPVPSLVRCQELWRYSVLRTVYTVYTVYSVPLDTILVDEFVQDGPFLGSSNTSNTSGSPMYVWLSRARNKIN